MKINSLLRAALTTLVAVVPSAAQVARPSLPPLEAAIGSVGNLGAPRISEGQLFHVIKDRLYGQTRHLAVLKLSLLGRPLLLTTSMEQGFDSADADWTRLVVFRLSGDRVHFLRRQLKAAAPEGTPERLSAERTFQDELIAAMPVVSSSAAQGTVVFPLDPAFLADPTQVGIDAQRQHGGRLSLSPTDSAVERVSVFPKNAELLVRFVFLAHQTGAPQGLEPRVTALMRYGLSELPEDTGYQPRRADARVGYFTSTVADYADPARRHLATPAVEYINRWDLRKRDPGAEVSEVENPVVFWLDETVPLRYRETIASAVLSWNAAFEAVGLRGALQVKQVDRDMGAAERAAFDPADARYNVIRWVLASASATGLPRVNPLTGQILSATIRLTESFVRGALDMELLEPAGGASVLSDGEREKVSLAGLFETVIHEVGHTLGLKHNFAASGHPDASGFASSVMDYNPVFVSTTPGAGGPFFNPAPGRYDRWAIAYGYEPILGDAAARERRLAEIAGRASSEPDLAYASDEHADKGDPDVRRFDQGSGFEYAQMRVEQSRRLWRRLEGDEALDAAKADEAYRAGIWAVARAADAAAAYVGGVRGRDGSRSPVPAAEQRRALAWLSENIFASGSLDIAPGLARRLQPERGGAEVHPKMTSDLREGTLKGLYAAKTLRRLAESAGISTDPSGTMSVSEMSDTVRRSVWSEAAAGGAVGADRRALQRSHIAVLAKTLGDPEVHPDGRMTARRDLERIIRDADSAAARTVDDDARMHWVDAVLRARRALEDPPTSASAPSV